MTAYCRKCNSIIEFAITENGSKMPIDPDLVCSDDCDHGTVIVTEQGEVVKVCATCESVDGYVSHFSTCPYADN